MGQILSLTKNIYGNNKYLLFFIFFASVAFSFIFLLFFRNIGPFQHKDPGSDYFVYFKPIADNILQGKGITLDGALPLNIGPIFPIILSGVFVVADAMSIDRFQLVVLLNVILTALSSCFLFLLAKEIFGKKIAFISSILWMSYPFNLWFLKNPHTEVPFIPLLYLGIFFYVLTLKNKNFKYAILAGLFLGLSSATRIIALFFAPFLAVLLFFFIKNYSFKLRAFLVMLILFGNIIVIIPWAGYALQKSGSFIPLSKLGKTSFVFGFVSILPQGNREGIHLSEEAKTSLQKVKTVLYSENEKYAFRFLLKEIFSHPLIYLYLGFLRVTRVWYATYSMWWENKILAVQSFYLATGVFGIFYAFKKHKENIINTIFILSVGFYFWTMTVMGGSILRYMVPFMGLVMIFSAIAIDRLAQKLNLYAKIGFNNNSLQE